MDRELFDKDPQIRGMLLRVIPVRLYTYGGGHPTAPRWRALLKDCFGTSSIPYYVVLTPEDQVVGTAVYKGGALATLKADLMRIFDEALAGTSPR